MILTQDISKLLRSFTVAFALLGIVACSHLTKPQAQSTNDLSTPYPLVIAADRGFMGNELLRETLQMAGLNNDHLLIVGKRDLEQRISIKINQVKKNGIERLLILPYFLSSEHYLWKQTKFRLGYEFCGEETCPSLIVSKPLGESYLVREAVFGKLESVDKNAPIIVLVTGADSEQQGMLVEQSMHNQLAAVFNQTGHQLKKVFVWRDNYAYYKSQIEQLKQLAHQEETRILTFHLGRKLDGMMNLNSSLKRYFKEQLIAQEPLSQELASTWISAQTNRFTPVTKQNLGVIFLAHGSDIVWNESMREAAKGLAETYDTEIVFSMADKETIERAVRKFEQSGKRHLVILRIFGQSSSFKNNIEKMFGMASRVSHHEQHGHGHHSADAGSGYIVSSLNVTTVGGLDAHDYFAQVLLERAKGLSVNPQKEIVVLAAHGKGDDKENDVWKDNLKQLLDKMNSNGGEQFYKLDYVTWREDWEGKQAEALNKMNELFDFAKNNDLEIIIIPARTTGQGPAQQLLIDKSFKLGTGFAPHPLFTRWTIEMTEQGIATLQANSQTATPENVAGIEID